MGDMSYDADEAAFSRDAKAEARALIFGDKAMKEAKARQQQQIQAAINNASQQRADMRVRYDVAKTAAVGSTIACPTCQKQYIKSTYNKVFCTNQKTVKTGKNSCKDKYWNRVVDTRRERAEEWKDK